MSLSVYSFLLIQSGLTNLRACYVEWIKQQGPDCGRAGSHIMNWDSFMDFWDAMDKIVDIGI